VKSGIRINMGVFRDSIHEYLRASGYSQKELAASLGLHPKVLSRKLHGNGNARLTHLEVRRIITTLARWQAITTQDEALHRLQRHRWNLPSFAPTNGGHLPSVRLRQNAINPAPPVFL
jgi:transcriptional regulator with XRE-family HTH domain